MAPAGSQRGCTTGQAAHGDRHAAGIRRRRLAEVGISPALHHAAAQKSAGVLGRCCESRHTTGQTVYGNRRTAVVSGAVTELSPQVPSPALNPARPGEDTGVFVSRSERGHWHGHADDSGRHWMRQPARSIPDLVMEVLSPALHAAAVRDHARVVVAGDEAVTACAAQSAGQRPTSTTAAKTMRKGEGPVDCISSFSGMIRAEAVGRDLLRYSS